MGLFDFFKKKEVKESAFSSRKRRVIASQGRMPVTAKPGSGGSAPAAPPGSQRLAQAGPRKPSGPQKPVAAASGPAAPAAAAPVGQLKRGEQAALKFTGNTDQADEALRDFIIESELGPPDKVRAAFNDRSEDAPFIMNLVTGSIINENDLLVALSKKCMIPQGKLAKYRIRKKALECMDSDAARKLMIIPVDKLGQILSVAMVNPLNTDAVKTIGTSTGLRVKTVVCTYSEFKEQFEKHYGAGGEPAEASEETLDISIDEPEAISPEDFKRSIAEASARQKKKESAQMPAVTPAPAPAEAEEAGVLEIEEVADTNEPVEIMEVVEPPAPPVVMQELIMEPIIEGIDLSNDDEEEAAPVIEPIIISVDMVDETEEEAEIEYVDALQVVEEEFRQGITIGAMDLFKKWENLHRKNRIITLKQVPEDVFSFLSFE